jgi:glycosyltransferase involved in cell wall biosynthesis
MINNFNYIIPIFNKEDILPQTLEGIDLCASREAKIYMVIDGCTDRSEQIIDEFSASTRRNVVKIHMPDVHMLRSVNAALRDVGEGFSIVMQDDIVLQDLRLEEKILDLYRQMGDRLGVISLRMAANIAKTPILKRIRMHTITPMMEEMDYLIKANEPQKLQVCEYGKFYPRMAAINGPNIIPWTVLKSIGILDEALAPYGYDDPEYCLRAMKAGFVNGLFPLPFRSDVEWGGTRRSKKYLTEVARIHIRNRKYIWKKHGQYIGWLWDTDKVIRGSSPYNDLTSIPDFRMSL